jgi:hypothetical protein
MVAVTRCDAIQVCAAVAGVDNHVPCENRVHVINTAPVSSKRVFVPLSLTSKTKSKSWQDKVHPAVVDVLYDTGAAVSLLTPVAFQKFVKAGMVLREINDHKVHGLVGAGNDPLQINGVYDCQFTLENKTVHAPFVVSPSISGSILGMNIIRKYGIQLDPVTERVTFAKVASISAVSEGQKADKDAAPEWRVVVKDATTVSPHSGNVVPCFLQDKDGLKVDSECEFVAHLDLVSTLHVSTVHGVFRPHFPNASDEALEFVRGQTVGYAQDLADVAFVPDEAAAEITAKGLNGDKIARAHTPAETDAIREILKSNIDSSVPYMERQKYLDALMSREQFFSADSMDLGKADIIEHEVRLSENDPVYTAQFRLPYDQLKLVRENVVGWTRAGIIEAANSPYNSPIFCVPKKGGNSLRVVLDYRKLNAKSLPDKYSIRTIDQCLEEIGNAQSTIFSCLDMTNGFWQLKCSESSRPYTAFTIPGVGQFQWCVTAQGLMGAPASFSRLMDIIMKDAQNVITYIDDVLVHSKTHEDHRVHLLDAIDRLGKAGLRLNPNKCTFGAREVNYLGHNVTSEGVRPGTDKTKALKEIKAPIDVKQVKSFVGLANYFRGYIKNFAMIAAPLYKLTRQDSDWHGGEMPPAALKAFDTIKEMLHSRPLLKYPRRDGTFHLFVDAALGDDVNEGGLGAMLMQDQPNGHKHPVGYASRRLVKHEKNYPTFLAEIAAANYGMEFFHHYLIGRPFKLYTDHKPMVKLSKIHLKTLNRLQIKMQELHPEILYIEGKNNTVADFLSRYQGLGCAQVDTSAFRLHHMQAEDKQCVDIMNSHFRELASEGKPLPNMDKISEFTSEPFKPLNTRMWCRIQQGVLYVRTSQRKGIIDWDDYKVLAPASLQKEIITEAHNSKIGGHGGAFKTVERLKKDFHWINMDRDIQDHIDQCTTCQSFSHRGRQPPPPLQPLPALTGPNQRLHVDLFGMLKNNSQGQLSTEEPLPTSERGNRYVMVVTDAFTKMVQAYPIPEKTAPIVAAKLLSHMYTFGIPRQIHSDQGSEFCNQLQNILWDDLNINHTVTSPYHPQCNASVEQFNKTMAQYIASAIIDAKASTLDWELFLGPMLLSYNTGVNKSTKVTPFYATFGYDPRVPLWAGLPECTEDQIPKDLSQAEYLTKLRFAQTTARGIVHHNSQDARQKMVDADAKARKTKFPTFKTGDLVWCRIHKKSEPNPKLAKNYEPGVIIGTNGICNYTVKRFDMDGKPKKGKPKNYNVEALKPRKVRETSHPSDADQDREDQLPDHDVRPRIHPRPAAEEEAERLLEEELSEADESESEYEQDGEEEEERTEQEESTNNRRNPTRTRNKPKRFGDALSIAAIANITQACIPLHIDPLWLLSKLSEGYTVFGSSNAAGGPPAGGLQRGGALRTGRRKRGHREDQVTPPPRVSTRVKKAPIRFQDEQASNMAKFSKSLKSKKSKLVSKFKSPKGKADLDKSLFASLTTAGYNFFGTTTAQTSPGSTSPRPGPSGTRQPRTSPLSSNSDQTEYTHPEYNSSDLDDNIFD